MKKILTILALMIATVAVVATGYTLTRPAKASGTNYTDNATSSWNNSNLTNYTGKTVTVIETGSGTYTFAVPGVEIAASGQAIPMADFTMEGVTGTTGSDGIVSYSFSGDATTKSVNSSYGFSEGGTTAVTLEGKSLGDKLYMVLKFKLFSTYEVVYTFGSEITASTDPETTVPGTVVGKDGYAPNSAKFEWTTDIDWNTQKLVVAIDVSKCSTYNANILSVGSQIDTWSNGAHFHFYYVPSTKAVKSNFLTSAKGNIARVAEDGIVIDSDELIIEISKKTGLTVNGVDFNYYYGGTEQFTDYETVYADLWALTNISVGSKEGNNRSDATYKYVRVQDLDKDTEPEPEPENAININTSTGTLSSFSGSTGWMSRWTSTQTEPQLVLQIVDYGTTNEVNNISKSASNETVIQAFRGLKDSEWKLSISDGWVITGYSFDVTLAAAGTNVKVTADGNTITPTTDAAQNVKVEGLNASSVVAFALIGDNKGVNITNWKVTYAAVTPEPEPEPVVYTDKAKVNFYGVDYDMTDQVVEITETGENLYTVVYKNLTLNDVVLGDFTAKNVAGTANEDGSISYSFDGKATISNANANYVSYGILTEGAEYPFTMEGSSKDGKLTATFTTLIASLQQTITVTYGSTTEPEPEYPTYSFSDKSLSWYGSVTGKNSNQTDVVITDKGEGLYDIDIKKLSCYGDQEVVFANVPGAALGKGTAFSTGGKTLEGTVSGARTGTATMTVEGKMMGDQLYLFCSGNFLGWSDNPFTITVGTDFDLVEPVTYTDKATTSFGGSYEQTFDDSQVNVYDNGDGTYKFVIKQYQFYTYLMGDFTANGVTGTTNEDGSISYSYNGKAKASNIGAGATAFGIGEGTEVDLAFTGKSKEDKLYVNGTVSFAGFNCTYVFGEDMDKTDPEPGTYTASAVVNYNEKDTNIDEQVVTITETGENTYTVVVKDIIAGTTHLGDYTATGVTGTVDEEGNVVYSFDGNAVTTNVNEDYANWGYISENGEVPFKMVGYSKDGVLKAKFTTSFMSTELTLRFNGYTDPVDPEPEPEVPGKVVGEDNYAPAGQQFEWTTDIDWNTQKLVAALDVTGCTGSYENILSVGQTIGSWNGETFHLYYSRSSKKLQVNYCTTSGNPIRMEKVVDADELIVEITKAGGITVNGEAWNYTNNDNNSGDLTDDMSVYANLWALTSVSVGSKEGGTRSNATYKYVRVQDIPVSITETETFYDDMTVTEPSTKEKSTENAQLDINTYSDGTYGVTIHEVAGEETTLGDITVKGLGVTEENGVTYYNAETSITLNEAEWTATVTGVKYADGKVWFQVELMNAEEDIYHITVGHEQKGDETGINAINAAARDGKADIYTINGVKVNAMQKGINIVRMNGKTVKIVKK